MKVTDFTTHTHPSTLICTDLDPQYMYVQSG